MQIMTLSEIHMKWKHFKALLLMELNVRLIDNIRCVPEKVGMNVCVNISQNISCTLI